MTGWLTGVVWTACALTLSVGCTRQGTGTTGPQIKWGLVLHGGAGTIDRTQLTPQLEAEYRAALTEALQAGYRALRDGGASIDAVVAAITILEDSPLFNAGRGAVFTADGINSLDASVMRPIGSGR